MRINRALRPQHNHTLCGIKLAADLPPPSLARQQSRIPKHTPPARLQNLHQRPNPPPILARVTDKNVTHSAMCPLVLNSVSAA
jgi:hypothetical protein